MDKRSASFRFGGNFAAFGNGTHNPIHIRHLPHSSRSYTQAFPPNLWIAHPDADTPGKRLARGSACAR
ncbi:hypothetical protein PSAC2689_190062 [Paraburkholderia sacchari]